MSLESMPSAEHERFLGEMLHPFVQAILSIHLRTICLSSTRNASVYPFIGLCTVSHIPWKARVQAVDPARAGKLTGMLLELDVHEIIPLLVFPDMVR